MDQKRQIKKIKGIQTVSQLQNSFEENVVLIRLKRNPNQENQDLLQINKVKKQKLDNEKELIKEFKQLDLDNKTYDDNMILKKIEKSDIQKIVTRKLEQNMEYIRKQKRKEILNDKRQQQKTLNDPKMSKLQSIFDECKEKEQEDEQSVLIFDIKTSDKVSYLLETNDKNLNNLKELNEEKINAEYDYYYILKEEEINYNKNMQIQILNVDENIISKYHYDNENKKENYIQYNENEDSNSEDNPYNDYPDESDDSEHVEKYCRDMSEDNEREEEDYEYFSKQFYQNMKNKQKQLDLKNDQQDLSF